jgi:hypothetical protein
MLEVVTAVSRLSRNVDFCGVSSVTGVEREMWSGRGTLRGERRRVWICGMVWIDGEWVVWDVEVMSWVRVVSSVGEGYPRVR